MASPSSASPSAGGEENSAAVVAAAAEPATLPRNLLLGVFQHLQAGEAVVVSVCRSWRAAVSDQIAAAARRVRVQMQEKPPPRSNRRGRDGIPPKRQRRRANRKPSEFRVVCR